jgi:hypothetical protein
MITYEKKTRIKVEYKGFMGYMLNLIIDAVDHCVMNTYKGCTRMGYKINIAQLDKIIKRPYRQSTTANQQYMRLPRIHAENAKGLRMS